MLLAFQSIFNRAEKKLLGNLKSLSRCRRTRESVGRDSDSLRAGRSGNRIPVGARFSAPVQTGPGAHPASCAKGIGSLYRAVKRPGRGVEHPPPLALRLEKEYSYTSTPLSAFIARSRVNLTYLVTKAYYTHLATGHIFT